MGGEVVVYEASDGVARVEVIVGEDTVWLTEAQMADLFDGDRSVIGRHIRNAFWRERCRVRVLCRFCPEPPKEADRARSTTST